ncbi:MAG: hypothetical protein B1H12_10065, partial [Desulfobacteraceae bacterium 4484_190.2]
IEELCGKGWSNPFPIFFGNILPLMARDQLKARIRQHLTTKLCMRGILQVFAHRRIVSSQ